MSHTQDFFFDSSIGSSVEDPDPAFKRVHSSRVYFLLDYFLICEPLYRVPQDINLDPSAKSALGDGECLKVDNPRVLRRRELRQIPQSPQAQRVREAPLVLAVL
jgi:hypothetical protein